MVISLAMFIWHRFFILHTYSCVIATVKKEEFISILPPPARCLPAGLYTHPQYMLRVRNRRNRNFFNTCKKPNSILVSIDWFMMSTSYIPVHTFFNGCKWLHFWSLITAHSFIFVVNKYFSKKNVFCHVGTQTLIQIWMSTSAGKSLSEALILGSTNPEYDKRLFINLPVQYMKTTSSEHDVYINCSECQNNN